MRFNLLEYARGRVIFLDLRPQSNITDAANGGRGELRVGSSPLNPNTQPGDGGRERYVGIVARVGVATVEQILQLVFDARHFAFLVGRDGSVEQHNSLGMARSAYGDVSCFQRSATAFRASATFDEASRFGIPWGSTWAKPFSCRWRRSF